MRSIGNAFVRHAAGWTASVLAVAVSLLGRSGEVTTHSVNSPKPESFFGVGQGTEIQVSYVQLGFKEGEDWPPPRPE